MDKMIKVNFRDLDTFEFAEGTTLYEVSRTFQKYFNYPILVAKVDNDIANLGEPLIKRCSIDFYDRSSTTGNSIYGRSCQFLLVVAVKKVLGPNAEVIIQYSIDKGFYCEVVGVEIDKPIVKKLEDKMREIAQAGLMFTKVSVERLEAIKYFKKKHQFDKVKVLKYISNSYISLYRLDDIYDYFYGEIAYHCGDIDDFKLTYIRDNGFVLNYPTVYNPECTLDYVHHEMIFDTFLSYTKWGRNLNINNAADLNEIVSTGKYDDIIHLAEAYYDGQLARIADSIYEHKDRIKLVLIAGPTSSGKTTTAKKLAVYLRSKGLNTHQISIDDYFVSRDKTPLNQYGEPDFESLKAIDLDLFNRHLSKLLDGERVLLPTFNFRLGKREFKDHYLELGPNDIVVIEGLHGLNEELTVSIPRNQKFKIYISPLTQLNIDNHNRIHTSDTRKLRRIIRDNKYRGYNVADTLRMWQRIREGEEKYIFPFQDDADMIVNSALIYELGILKTYAEPLLFSVSEDDEVYPEALRLINFLRNFLPIPSEEVPRDSVLREFIGGSCYKDN